MSRRIVNGFAGFGGNNGNDFSGKGKFDGGPEFDFNKYLEELTKISNSFNTEIRIWVARREEETNKLFFSSERDEDGLGLLYEQLYTKANQAYDKCLVSFRHEWEKDKTKYPCRLPAMAPATCQIRQLTTVLETLIAAHKLANSLKPSIYRNVQRNQVLQAHYRQILENVKIWKIDDRVTVKGQLMCELALFGDAQARQLFSDLLQELFHPLALEFDRYCGCEPFGCQPCLLCDEKWATTIFSKIKNEKIVEKIEEEKDPQYFCVSLLRQTLYQSLLDFIDCNW